MIYTIKTQDLTGNTVDKGITGIEFDLETIDDPAGFSQITVIQDFNMRTPVTLVTDDLREILQKLIQKLNSNTNTHEVSKEKIDTIFTANKRRFA